MEDLLYGFGEIIIKLVPNTLILPKYSFLLSSNILIFLDGYIYSSFESSGTTPGYFLSVNFPKDARPNVVQQGCLRFWYLLQGKGKASLRVSFIN